MAQENKYAEIFADAIQAAELANVSVASASHNDDWSRQTVEVTIQLPDVADWELRYRILEIASSVEEQMGLSVRCYFRQSDHQPA